MLLPEKFKKKFKKKSVILYKNPVNFVKNVSFFVNNFFCDINKKKIKNKNKKSSFYKNKKSIKITKIFKNIRQKWPSLTSSRDGLTFLQAIPIRRYRANLKINHFYFVFRHTRLHRRV